MVREEIVEGLKLAMSKGETLLQAMMSFYNSGYSKKEIEEAAQALQTQAPGQVVQTQKPVQQPVKKISQPKPVKKRPAPQQQRQPPKQHVSQYGEYKPQPEQDFKAPKPASDYGNPEKHPLSMGVTIFLVFVLLVLLASLISLFIFRDIIVNFFG